MQAALECAAEPRTAMEARLNIALGEGFADMWVATLPWCGWGGQLVKLGSIHISTPASCHPWPGCGLQRRACAPPHGPLQLLCMPAVIALPLCGWCRHAVKVWGHSMSVPRRPPAGWKGARGVFRVGLEGPLLQKLFFQTLPICPGVCPPPFSVVLSADLQSDVRSGAPKRLHCRTPGQAAAYSAAHVPLPMALCSCSACLL